MTKHHAEQIAQELRDVSPDVKGSSAFSMKEDGIQPFMIWTSRVLTTEEMILLCQKLAVAIRRRIPDRPDGWAARILAGNMPAMVMGDYYLGWASRADEWDLREGQEVKATDQGNWQAFRNHLRVALAAIGTEGERAGDDRDFTVGEADDGQGEHVIFVSNPEFLTQDLIATIQNALRQDRPDGVVNLFPAFGEPFETLWKGVDVRADSVEEKWNRQEAEKLLGDRLKI